MSPSLEPVQSACRSRSVRSSRLLATCPRSHPPGRAPIRSAGPAPEELVNVFSIYQTHVPPVKPEAPGGAPQCEGLRSAPCAPPVKTGHFPRVGAAWAGSTENRTARSCAARPMWFAIGDPDGNFIWISPSVTHVLGYQPGRAPRHQRLAPVAPGRRRARRRLQRRHPGPTRRTLPPDRAALPASGRHLALDRGRDDPDAPRSRHRRARRERP